MSKLMLLFPALGVCLLLAFLEGEGSCRSKERVGKRAPVEGKQKLTNGVWGGVHLRAEVTDTGVEIEFDCARGAIAEPVVLDGEGRFDVKGKFMAQHGGPISRDEESNERAVRYAGQVKDKALTLSISDPATKENLGEFTLTYGSEGRIRKCL